MRHMILLNDIILQISEIYQPVFVFCRVYGAIYNMQMLFDGNTVLFYLPMDQTLKLYVK